MVDREDKRTNNRTMFPALKNNAAAGYQGPVKIELFAGCRSTADLDWCFLSFMSLQMQMFPGIVSGNVLVGLCSLSRAPLEYG